MERSRMLLFGEVRTEQFLQYKYQFYFCEHNNHLLDNIRLLFLATYFNHCWLSSGVCCQKQSYTVHITPNYFVFVWGFVRLCYRLWFCCGIWCLFVFVVCTCVFLFSFLPCISVTATCGGLFCTVSFVFCWVPIYVHFLCHVVVVWHWSCCLFSGHFTRRFNFDFYLSKIHPTAQAVQIKLCVFPHKHTPRKICL